MTERVPSNELPYYDPIIQFVVNGIRLSLEQNQMTRERAEELIKSWYGDDVAILDEEV